MLAAVLVFRALLPTACLAQTPPSCQEQIAAATQHYQEREFDRAIRLLGQCTDRFDTSTPEVVQASRLLILTYLRQQRTGDAKLKIIELLYRSPDYTADPIADPPEYVAMVDLVRQELQLMDEPLGGESPRVTDETSPRPGDARPTTGTRWRLPRTLTLTARYGATGYHGERSTTASSQFTEFTDAAGPGPGASLRYQFSQRVDGSLSYTAGRYPTLLNAKGSGGHADSQFEQIDPGRSSEWLHMLGISVSVDLLPRRRVSPFLDVGLVTTYSRINDTARMGAGPRLGVGLDAMLTRRLGIFILTEGLFIAPDTAADLADHPHSTVDLFSFVGGGLQYRVQRPAP